MTFSHAELCFFPLLDDIYHFVCEKWFAVEKEDGKVEREIMVADKGLSFSKVRIAALSLSLFLELLF